MSFKQLIWGVKASFRSYVEAAEGSINVSDGAIRTEDGSFLFKAIPGGDLIVAPDGSVNGSMRFQGKVTFEAHGGMLNATLSELGIDIEAGELVLTCLDAPMNKDRCAIAKLKLVDQDSNVAITLQSEITDDGMYQIADNYPTGTELDPVHLQ